MDDGNDGDNEDDDNNILRGEPIYVRNCPCAYRASVVSHR